MNVKIKGPYFVVTNDAGAEVGYFKSLVRLLEYIEVTSWYKENK